MTEPKLVSPLLDGFVIGNAMNEHDGISCHPAIKENTDEKYIVKIISIPASQVQMDALLLTGAYKDPADAMDYFKSVADDIIQEAEILQKLSKLEGFLSYDGWQIVPKEDGRLGSHIYLLGSYKRSLERHMRRTTMTHLEAVNLGLDLCQALAICRRAGYMYLDLKPSNIFISKNKEYRIGDLGFVSLDSLKYTSHPGKFFSAYSAPEGKDALNTVHTTADTYSVGMILYQVFNDGQLPDLSKPLLPPVNADYEISAIIMKAISPEPGNRWASPMEMGQALVGYMQRNSVNNTPLAPKTELITDPEAPVRVREEIEHTKALPNLRNIVKATPVPEKIPAPVEEISAATTVIPIAKVAAEMETPEPMVIVPPQTSVAVMEPEIPVEPTPEPVQEPAPEPEMKREDVIAAEISSLFTDDENSIEPEPLNVDIPSPAPVLQQPIYEEDDGFSLEGILDEDVLTEEDLMDEGFIEDVPDLAPPVKKDHHIIKKIFITLIVITVLAGLAVAGVWGYRTIYLQEIKGMELISTLDQVTVKLDTTLDDSLLTITCMDTYGNSMEQPVVNGEATFTQLLPNSQYKIHVEVSGFRKLTGKTSDVFNTAAQTNVVSFTAITGPEDGSVLLNLVVDGTDQDSWDLTYSASGEETQELTFVGHSVTIKGLAVGKTYTFTLKNPEGVILTGQSSVDYTSTALVMAENLRIVSCSNGNLTAKWDTPENAQVDSWTVRCYNDADYEQVQENVIGTEATFTDVDTTRAYTVEVIASGMTQPIRTNITTNPITVTAFTASEETEGKLEVSWRHEGKEPVGGWLLMYRLDDSEKSNVVKCDKASTTISPKVPNSTYHFEIQAADSTSIFSNYQEFKTTSPDKFECQGAQSDKITPKLLKTPEDKDWTYESINNDAFTDSFASGESISVVLQSSIRFYLEDEEINALYVIRDENGGVRSDLITEETLSWKDLWYDGSTQYGELDLPVAPTEAGKYTLDIYFNNLYLTTASFTIN